MVASARKPASAVQHLVLLAAAHAALALAIQVVGHQAVQAAEAAADHHPAVAAIAAPWKLLQRP